MSVAEWLHDPKVRPFTLMGQMGIAVLIEPGTKHVGVLFRRTIGRIGELRLLHLADHHDVRCSAPTTRYVWTSLDVDPTREVLFAQLCELLEEEYTNSSNAMRSKLGYAFHYRGETFDPMNGVFVTANGHGLTCATFVLAIFATHGMNLLDWANWECRETDTEWQGQVVADMKQKSVDPKHVAFIEGEIGCCRFRPEEVAAAGTVEGTALPLGFRDAESRGVAIVTELFRRATPVA